jgi:hypothetical protein
MTDFDRLDRLRGHFHTSETAIAKPDCLDEHTVAALADGNLEAEARGRALTHVATCALCRRSVASVAEALADGPITREIEVVEGRRRRRVPLLRIAVPLGAAATVLLLLWSPALNQSSVHRGSPPPLSTATPVPHAPVGTVAAVHDFRWSYVAGADRYRVTVFDAAGSVLFAAEASDTIVAFPDSIALAPGAAYLWKVDARTGFDRWAGSVLTEFSIAQRR